MKKIYISIFILAVSFNAIAQLSHNIITVAKPIKSFNNPSISAEKSAPFWSEDFADGIPPAWTNSSVAWVYRGLNTIPDNTVGGQGAYSGINNSPATNEPINSNTTSNGFIIFDSDYYDNNGVIGAFGTGMHPTPHNGELMTDMIDMSAYSDVALTFNSFYRTFAGQAFIDFYVDGVFSERVRVHANISVNNSTFIDQVAYVRVPFAVAGNPNVQLSFVFEGTTNVESGFSGYYFWQIDDLALSATPENLIEIEDVVVGGYWIDYTNYTGTGPNEIIGLDYSITPVSQLANHPYVIEGIIRNLGYADQTSMLNYEVTGTAPYLGSSSLTTIFAYSSTNIIDSVIVGTPPFSPPIGVYDIAIWGQSDSLGLAVLSTDTVTKKIEVSDYIYGKDLGNLNPSSSILGGPGDQKHIVTRYEMYADEQLYSIRAYITGRSAIGALVKAIIYEVDTTATSNSAFLVESDNYILTAQDTGTWIDIPFTNPISLFNGYAYEAGVVGFQSATDSSYVGISGKSMYNGEHRSFDEYGLSTQSAGTPTWYYITSTPMVRLNFDPASVVVTPAGLEDLKSNISVYPNPSNGIFVVELDTPVQYTVNVYNVLGKRVYTNSTNSKNTIIDLSSFDNGMFTLELETESAIYTQKVIID